MTPAEVNQFSRSHALRGNAYGSSQDGCSFNGSNTDLFLLQTNLALERQICIPTQSVGTSYGDIKLMRPNLPNLLGHA
jgi:hypothetical protein